jgi:hypothetical protein
MTPNRSFSLFHVNEKYEGLPRSLRSRGTEESFLRDLLVESLKTEAFGDEYKKDDETAKYFR